MGTGYKNRGSGAAGLGFKNRGAKLVEGAAYTNRGATDGTNETFKNRGQAWGSELFYNRAVNDFGSLSSPLNSSEFYAPLTHSLILTRGTGDPTYSRATNAWEFDNEGKLIRVPSGAARFGGARMVRNHFVCTNSKTLAGAQAVNAALSTTADGTYGTVGVLTGNGVFEVHQFRSLSGLKEPLIKFKVKKGSEDYLTILFAPIGGSGDAMDDSIYSLVSGEATKTDSTGRTNTTITLLADGWWEVTSKLSSPYPTATSVELRIGLSSNPNLYVSTSSGTILLTDVQVDNIAGQADQTASEYVSVGVLSAPYHGAGVDGVKWFDTNKDGSAIAASSLLGYHSEGARTNSLLYSRDLTKYCYNTTPVVKYWVPNTTGSELIANGDFPSDTSSWTGNAYAALSVDAARLKLLTNGAGGAEAYQAITTVSGKQYIVTCAADKGTVSINASIKAGTTQGDYNLGYANITATGELAFKFTAAGTTTYICVYMQSGEAAGNYAFFDNISVKEAAIQVTTCTGIDNAANSASTLTAGAANATILQTLTLASAARSSSAYVKRRTGTGTISFTRDGGTTWTDITSQINSSTWTRVKIENSSVLNPSIGFLIATSGDAIDVDVVQDEAGAFISSPIITTTAAVTRNADAETFQTASNWSDTAGWALATVQGESWANATGTAIGNGTNGLKLSASNSGIVAYDGTNTVNGPAGSPSGAEKLAMTWGSGALQAASGGVAGSAGSYDGAWGLATVGIGTSQGNVYIKDVYIGQSALTAAQLVQVTT